MPFLLGVRITPIRGLGIPPFDELRVPLAFVSADSELRTPAALRPVTTAWSTVCDFSGPPPFPCSLVPKKQLLFSKNYDTVTHLDAILTARKSADVVGHMPLFTVGFVEVSFGFHLTFFLGALGIDDDRVLSLPPLPLPTARVGRLWTNPLSRNQDGPWSYSFGVPSILGGGIPPGSAFWIARPDGLADPFWREEAIFGPTTPPLDLRLLQNDDHVLESATGIDISASLSGQLGKSFGPFTLTLSVSGTLSGGVAGRHVIRDQLFAQDQGLAAMTPVTGLSVRSHQTAHATLDPATGTLTFELSLPWPLDDIEFTKELFSIENVELADYDTEDHLAATESDYENFRLGTGSARGSVTRKPSVRSHLPEGPEFPSFGPSVATCLANTAPNPVTPPPCKGAKDTGKPPKADVCLYADELAFEDYLGVALPSNVCDDVPGWVASLPTTPEGAACANAALGYLCSDESKPQNFPVGGPFVVSHVVDFDDPSEGNALANAMQLCAEAFGAPLVGDPEGDLVDSNAVAVKIFQGGLCKSDGMLLAEDEILGAINPSTPPPVQTAPACQ